MDHSNAELSVWINAYQKYFIQIDIGFIIGSYLVVRKRKVLAELPVKMVEPEDVRLSLNIQHGLLPPALLPAGDKWSVKHPPSPWSPLCRHLTAPCLIMQLAHACPLTHGTTKCTQTYMYACTHTLTHSPTGPHTTRHVRCRQFNTIQTHTHTLMYADHTLSHSTTTCINTDTGIRAHIYTHTHTGCFAHLVTQL